MLQTLYLNAQYEECCYSDEQSVYTRSDVFARILTNSSKFSSKSKFCICLQNERVCVKITYMCTYQQFQSVISIKVLHSVYTQGKSTCDDTNQDRSEQGRSSPAATKEACEGWPNFACHTRVQQNQPYHFNPALCPNLNTLFCTTQLLLLRQGWSCAVHAVRRHLRIQIPAALLLEAAGKGM